jgi:CHAT domain-containing protein
MRIIAFAIAWLSLVATTAVAQAPPAFTPEQQAKLEKRNELLQEALASAKAGMFKEAVALLEKILVIERDVLGKTHPNVLNTVSWLAQFQERMADYASAGKTWAELAALRAKVLGKDHWQTVDAGTAAKNAERLAALTDKERARLTEAAKLNLELHALYDQGRYSEGLPLAVEVVRIRREVLGEKHPELAAGISWLAQFYLSLSRHTQAEPLFAEALKIYREVLGEKHPNYATALDRIATLYKAMGRYTKALYIALGRFAKAEPLFVEALRIRRELLGEKHPGCAESMHNLAILYASQGQFAKAEPILVGALAITRESLGEKHPYYANSLNNLASLYRSQGLYTKAEPLYLETLKIRKASLGEKHPDYAETLDNLARLYWAMGLYAKAEPLYLDALRIRKATLGEKHSDYAATLNNLALLYEDQGYYAKAEPLYLTSLEICREAVGANHLDYATGVCNLAGLYAAQKKYAKAEPLHLEALRIDKELLGPKHPNYARDLNNLALLYMSWQPAKAEPLFVEAVGIWQEKLESSAAVQSQADQLSYLAFSRNALDNYLAQPGSNTATLYSAVFRWHGSVTARQTFERTAARSSPEMQSAIEELRDRTRRLNLLTQNPPQGIAKAELTKKVKELEDQCEALQKKLAGQSKDFAAYLAYLKQTPADLQRILPEGTALIDFLAHGEVISAFIVTKTSIRRITLKAGKELNEEMATFLGDLSLGRTRPVITKDDVSAKLHARIWEPLEEHLKGVTRVLVCPDGPLCRLPFAALPGSDPKKYLVEELSIVMVPVPQLLTSEGKAPAGAPTLLAVGDVDFNGDPIEGDQSKQPLPVAISRAGDGLIWKRLPQTKGEAEVIEALFAKLPDAKVKELFGKDATETMLERELPKYRFVHLATHGFFSAPKMVRQFQEGQGTGEKVLVPSIPPGLSSGIVCAGANKPTFETSGVLTATQIAELDLSGVELAVLSACETGLGEISGGEGVLGLQRAFQMAGARSTISSLWAVDDRATAELMKRLYANRLQKNLSSVEALREAQLWVLNNGDKVGVFDEPPRAGKRTPPKFWAAFTLAGDGK